MKDRDGFIVVFDLSSKSSLNKIDKVYEQIYSHHPLKDIPIVLVGNKLDKNREVTTIEGEKVAMSYNSPYIECSAFTGENAEEIFFSVIRELRKR